MKLGQYRHFKGGIYCVLGVSSHTETGEKLVVYFSLDDLEHKKLYARPFTMFTDKVEHNGRIVKRFAYIGQSGIVNAMYDMWNGIVKFVKGYKV